MGKEFTIKHLLVWRIDQEVNQSRCVPIILFDFPERLKFINVQYFIGLSINERFP